MRKPNINNASTIKRKKKGHIIILSVVLGLILLLGIAFIILYHYKPFAKDEFIGGSEGKFTTSYKTPEKIKDKVMNILLCGVDYDSEKTDRGNRLSDVMMLVNYDIENQKVNILQIPRDTYVDDKYHTGRQNKINGIYNQKNGGVNGLIKAINENFALTVDHYVTIGMDDLRTIVDKLGGVEVVIEKGFTTGGGNQKFTFQPGKHTLTGEEAEAFVRERYAFADADLSRQNNQKILIAGLVNRLLSADMGEIVSLLPVLAKNVKSDLSVGEMLSLAATAKSLQKQNMTFHSPYGHYLYYRVDSGAKAAVFGMNREQTAEMLNTYFRSHSNPVPAEELAILQITDQVTVKDPNQSLAAMENKNEN